MEEKDKRQRGKEEKLIILKPERSYRNYEPKACCPSWVFHASAIPLPSTTFGNLEFLLYPCPQPVPAGIASLRWQVGKNKP
jgi:hypothetical protein